MTRLPLFVTVMSVLLLVPHTLVSADHPRAASIKNIATLKDLSDQQLEACGLHKLDQEEFEELLGLVTFFESPSFLEESAYTYLEREGWRPVQILGLIRLDDSTFPEVRLLVRDTYEIKELDPVGRVDDLPPPGVHWAKNAASSWEILGPDGDKSHLWER